MNHLDIFVSAFTLTFIFSNPLCEKMKTTYKVLLFFVALCSNYIFFYTPFITLATVFFLLFITVIHTRNRLINAIAALSGYILSVVSNYMMILFIQLVFKLDVTTIYSNLTYLITFYIVYFIVAYILTYLLGRIMKKHFSPEISSRYRHTTRLVFLEVLLCTSILVFNITYGRQIGYPAETIVFNCVLFFIYFIFSTALLLNVVRANKKSILAEQKEQQYAQLQDYMNHLEQTSMKLRAFKHDYLNTLLTLDTLIHADPSDEDFERKRKELVAYFDQNIKPNSYNMESIDTQFIGLANLKDSGLKSLISAKLNLASLEQIAIRVEVADEISQIPMDVMDIARILGIFLDNAIEETTALSKVLNTDNSNSTAVLTPRIYVAFIQMEDYLQIVVENTCLQEKISLEKLSDYGYSTKGEKRGYGLYETTQILSQYRNVIHKTTYHNNLFTQTLLIYPNDK